MYSHMNQRKTDINLIVGNDIIDLNLSVVANKADDLRFVKRICSPDEEDLLAVAEDQQLLLWYIWSAKESAYKIAKKYCCATVFSPQQFIVNRISSAIRSDTEASGEVTYQGMQIPVRWQHRSTNIHCVGVWPDQAAAFDEVVVGIDDLSSTKRVTGDRLSQQETESIHSVPSQRVRQLAKRLLAEHGVNNVEIIRHRVGNRWGPPRLWHDKRVLAEYDVSLSHHGQFIAAAVRIKAQSD